MKLKFELFGAKQFNDICENKKRMIQYFEGMYALANKARPTSTM
jgi:hypothetical protein